MNAMSQRGGREGGVAEKPLRDEDFSEVFQELYQTAKSEITSPLQM